MPLLVKALLLVLAHEEPCGEGFTHTAVLLPVPEVVLTIGFRVGATGTYDWDGRPSLILWDDYSE